MSQRLQHLQQSKATPLPSTLMPSTSKDSIQLASKLNYVEDSPDTPEESKNNISNSHVASQQSFNTRLLLKAEDIIEKAKTTSKKGAES